MTTAPGGAKATEPMNYETSIDRNALIAGEELDAATVRKRKRMFIALGLVGLLALLVLLVLRFTGVMGGKVAADNTSQVPLVTVAVPRQESVTQIANATGSLAARVDMPVGVVGEGGRVLSVLVQPGDWVGKGQTLAVIERSVQTQQIASLVAQVDVARANAKLAQSNLDRARALVDDGFISKADIDTRIATRDANVAQVNVTQAQLNQMRATVGRLDIRAPEAGLVLTRAVEPGQVVTGGSAVLFRIAQGGELELRALLSEDQLAALKIGTPAVVTPVGMTQTFTGTLWQISPVIDATTRQGIARFAVPYNQALRPGGFANAQIDMANVSATVLPESAVQSDAKGSYVYIVNKDNKIERRDIATGAVTEKGLAVTKGLTGTEKIVLYAGGFLNPGETVRPKIEQAGKSGK
jgi:RND family efflux transporter MFP subunit